MKAGWIIYLITVSTLFLASVGLNVYQGVAKQYTHTNQISFTNLIKRTVPQYIKVSLTNTNIVFITNATKVDTNILVILTMDDYGNLVLLVDKYGKYAKSDIEVTLSNDTLILSHFEVTNYYKIPEDVFAQIEKKNQIGLGIATSGRIQVQYYRRKVWKDIGFGANFSFVTNNFDIGAGIIYEFDDSIFKGK